MSKDTNKINNLHHIAQFSLFVSSYFFLFLIIIIRQIVENYDYLNWGGFRYDNFIIFLSKFGLSASLVIISVFGLFGFGMTFYNIEHRADNGFPVILKDVKNKSSESIGYIATYLIPFLFQSFNGWFECLSLIILLFVIYHIYVNSTLLLINPVINLFYATYEIEYHENGSKRNGLIISQNRFLQEDERIKIYEIGYKMYFAKGIKTDDSE